MRRLVLAMLFLLVLVLGATTASAQEARAQLSLDRNQQYVGMPFTLSMAVDGFDENPQPAMPKLEVPGATVVPIGVEPNVRESIQIFNGKRSAARTVTWVFRWSVTVAKPGKIRIGPVTAVQGSKRAVAPAGDVPVDSIPSTDEMKIQLELPQRTVYVGEMIEVKLMWLFTREPDDPQFSIPLGSTDAIAISPVPAADPRRTLPLTIGGKQLPVPFEVDEVNVGGQRMHRVTMRLSASPKQAGKLDLPGVSVIAGFPVGRADFFGRAPTKLFRATDEPRTMDVKPLPETDKPPGFAGAVGSQYSMQVATSRSVVQLGEPVELAITVKSDQRLDTLALPRLDGPGGLPKDKFTVPTDSPTGELSDDGKSKTFKVTAQVVGPASEIPAIAFSYFDAAKGHYQTIHSDPIAVSVKGGSIVGAGDVVGATPTKRPGGGAAATTDADVALVGAELALSSPSSVDDRPLGGMVLWLLVGALYAIPLGLFLLRTWQLRTQSQRDEAAEVKAARVRAEAELARAAKQPARETAGPLVAALRAFARTLERNPDDDGGLFAKIETESFAPSAAASPLPADLRDRAADLIRRWTGEARRKRTSPKAAATAALLLATAATLGAPRTAHAASADQTLADGRAAYQEAMGTSDASVRKAAFSRAASALGDAARAFPDRPELLTDWGNAALGAGDIGTATLAYRRALALDGSTPRALRNLAWLRSRQADALRPGGGTATDALLFFHHWPWTRRVLVGSCAFAACILLLVPWGGRRRRGLTGLAALPFVIWLAMLASIVLEDRRTSDAIVMDSVILRAADSMGAPAAFSQQLPRGTEVTLVERRDTWARIKLANGTAGWVPEGAVERVAK
jgi:hypothetical protein